MKALLALFIAASALMSRPAVAANRTACFWVRIQMGALSDAPTSQNIGVRRPASPSLKVAAFGQVVELWDKDVGNPDDYIGRFVIAGFGRVCATFPYEGQSYYEANDPNPDLYIKLPLEVMNTNIAGPILRAVRDDRSDYPSYSWRGSDGDDTSVYNNCPAGISCNITEVGEYLSPTSNPIVGGGAALQLLDMGQRMLEVYGGALGTSEIRLEYPTTDQCLETGACTFGESDFGFDNRQLNDAKAVAHELGHVLQQRMMQGTPPGGCTQRWEMDGATTQSCATQEGWAVYVSGASWWDPGGANDAESFDFGLEPSQPVSATCSGNIGIPLQVAKAFWDLDDWNNEAATSPATVADNQNAGTTTIAHIWEFPDGTGNGQTREPNPNGRNMWDFANAEFGLGSAFITHNCLQAQDATGY